MNSSVFLALAPIVLLIGLGMVLRARSFLTDAFWPQAERLAYFVLLPALFVHGLATADLGGLPALDLGATLILSILAVAAMLALAQPLMRIDGAGFTSIFQGGIRFNNYVGVTLAAGLFGAKGVALAAICNAAIVPTVNVLCVLVFARNGTARPSLGGVLRQLATNPLLVSCLVGVGLQLAGVRLPPGVDPALKALGAASLPLGLLCVGAALEFHAARKWVAPVAISSAAKFVLLPLVTLAIGKALEAPRSWRRCCSMRCRPPRPPTSWRNSLAATRLSWRESPRSRPCSPPPSCLPS